MRLVLVDGEPRPFICHHFALTSRIISICAGMHYADTMLFIAMACILAAFDIAPIKDENGNEVRPELRFNSHIVRYIYSHPISMRGLDLSNIIGRLSHLNAVLLLALTVPLL